MTAGGEDDRVDRSELDDNSTEMLARALESTSILFGIGGAAVSIAAPPVALGLGVGAGVLQLAALVRGRWSRRAGSVAAAAENRLGGDAASAAERVTSDENLAALAYRAMEASVQAQYEDQPEALGRVLGDALRSDDPLSIDEAAIFVEALRLLDRPHLRALLRLADDADRDQEHNWMRIIAGILETPDEAIAFGLGSALQRAGVVHLDPPGFGGYTVTPFGRRLLRFLEV